jgi:protein-disulfide isomerase
MLKPPVNNSDHILGSPVLGLILVEYGDFQCPSCREAHPVIKELLNAFDNKIGFVYRHFPMSTKHEYALPAAIASEAAARQDKFWQMHDIIFDNQQMLNNNTLIRFANVIKLDISIFKNDLQDPLLLEKVEADFESGIRSGVNGTPSFYINADKFTGSINNLFAAIEEHVHPVL